MSGLVNSGFVSKYFISDNNLKTKQSIFSLFLKFLKIEENLIRIFYNNIVF